MQNTVKISEKAKQPGTINRPKPVSLKDQENTNF